MLAPQQCLDAMGKAKYFSTLDCISAFWNIPVSKTTQELTAVNFPWGKFAFTGMPMGMQAASAHYQRSAPMRRRCGDRSQGGRQDSAATARVCPLV